MSRTRRLILGGAVSTAVALGAAMLSAWPTYRALPEGAGVVKLSFSHGGQRVCRDRTPAELAKLPANMRRKQICDRLRPPVYVELDVDGARTLEASLPPSGVAGDGPSRIYRRFTLPAGEHEIGLRLRDTPRAEGFDYTAERRVRLRPAQNLVIDFSPEAGGFVFR